MMLSDIMSALSATFPQGWSPDTRILFDISSGEPWKASVYLKTLLKRDFASLGGQTLSHFSNHLNLLFFIILNKILSNRVLVSIDT